jgi:hypothetical protein
MKRCLALAAAALALVSPALAQTASSGQDARDVLASAAAADKYTFLFFYKDNTSTTQAMARALKQHLAARAGEAEIAFVQANHPSQVETVNRFKVGRAPMPLVVAVAPNGAITGMFPTRVTAQQIAGAIVTPAMAQAMKSMQAGRLVFVVVSEHGTASIPQGVEAFQTDPQFASRADVVSLDASDPAEGDFLKQLKIEPATFRGTTTAFLAPPAVLVGKFSSTATMEEMAAALHAAGKCCDDPNCKHNHKH